MICMISFNKFWDVLPTFTCSRAIDNLWSICLGVNILRLEWSETLSRVRSETFTTRPKFKNMYLKFLLEMFCSQKHQELFSLPSKSAYKCMQSIFCFCFLSGIWGFIILLKFIISTNKLLWFYSVCFRVIVTL